MKTFEITPQPPPVEVLLRAAQQGGVLLLRGGRPVARLERFGGEDRRDWTWEHSEEAIRIGQLARAQYARGECVPIQKLPSETGS
jgi:hypothetical protein